MASTDHGRVVYEEFIRLYESEPCLWKIKHKDYHNRVKKEQAYAKLVEKLREIHPDIDRSGVTKKINCMRTNYKKERRRVEKSIRSALSPGDVRVPTLWYYNLFAFLHNREIVTKDSASIVAKKETIDYEDEGIIWASENEASNAEDGTSSVVSSLDENARVSRPPNMSANSNIANDLQNRSGKCGEDRYDLFGRMVAIKLRDLHQTQKLIAEKLINDVLFDAEMGELTTTHKLYKNT